MRIAHELTRMGALLVVGNETTTNLIGNGMLALLRHPEQLERLRAEPGLLDTAVEELLRRDSPVQYTARIPTSDLEFRGHRFRKGDIVVAVLGSANRDPEAFTNPEQLDVGRVDNRHLSFGLGHGIHFRLGAQLARIEAQIAFRELLRRFSRSAPARDQVAPAAPDVFARAASAAAADRRGA